MLHNTGAVLKSWKVFVERRRASNRVSAAALKQTFKLGSVFCQTFFTIAPDPPKCKPGPAAVTDAVNSVRISPSFTIATK